MGRTKGATNKKPAVQPLNTELTTEERLEFLANLIVDKMLIDKNSGKVLPREGTG